MARSSTRRKLSDHAAAKSDLDKIAGFLQILVLAVGVVVSVIFTVISIRDVRFDNIPAFFGPTTFTKFALGLFFLHWAWGVKTDLTIQWRHYHRDPNHGALLKRSVAAIILFIVFFIALFWIHAILVWFQLILLFLICANYFSWWAIISQSNEMAESSREELTKAADWFALEQLELVYHYMNGRWQQIRFITLICLCLVQLFVALALAGWWPALDGARDSAAALLGPRLLPHVPGMLFFAYVLISCAWMGAMRLRVLFGLRLIQALLQRYSMRRRVGGTAGGDAS